MFEETKKLEKAEDYDFADNIAKEDVVAILTEYAKIYDENDEKQVWFDKIKSICEPLGFSADMKAYKKNPQDYKGSVADVSGVIRVAITGRRMSPDLYFVKKLLGSNEVQNRLNNAINAVK